MKKHFTATNLVLALALVACSICILSFRGEDSTAKKSFRTDTFQGDDDTTPPRKRSTDADEFRMDQLDAAMKKLDVQMAKLNEKMAKMDFSKMQKNLDESLSKIDFKKMEKEMEASMKKFNGEKMEADLKKSLEKMKHLQLEKMHQHFEKAKMHLEKQTMNMHFDAAKIKAQVENSMTKPKVSIEKAKADMENRRAFTTALEKDGLIDKNKGYKVQLKNGELYINDILQSKEVTEKYKGFYRKENFTIISSRDDNWI